MPDTVPPGRVVLRRSLGAVRAGGIQFLDAVAWPARKGRSLRLFCASGTPPEAVIGAGSRVSERREVSGGVLVVGHDRKDKGAPVDVTGPEGAFRIAASEPEWDLFAGRNVCLALRTVETPSTVAEWVRYHAETHGMTGALIVNRAGGGQPDFARDVAAATAGLGQDVVIVVLDAPVPLGKPGLGPESHPFLAPDAPGKDRMEQPEPDPWLAPLGEGLIYEIAKWRFLRLARSVVTVDVSDLLVRPGAGEPNAFDLCTAVPGKVVLLVGRRIYPWRIRDGVAERFGDHICRPFDSRRGITRWGVAAAEVDPEKTWRSTRIAYAAPAENVVIPFWRAMALRVPGRKPSELAPKSSLVEDPELVDLARSAFGHDPVLPPRSGEVAAARAEAGKSGTVIVTTMKNEGPFILEWIAYHRSIGVTGFLVYTNDCTDGTDELLDALAAQGIVERRDNPFRQTGLKPQHAALQAAEHEDLVKGSAWVVCMDVDEFINVKLGEGTLSDLYAAMEGAMPGANMIAMTWRLFGNADVHLYEDRFVTEQFTLCAPEVVRKPHQAWGFKTLFRNIDIYTKLGVHRPKGLRPDLWDQIRWLNGSGRPMPREMFRNGWRSSTDTYGYDWVSLNHYAVRSAESFLVKRDRGRVNHVDRDQGLNYWFRMNHNAVEEPSILKRLPAARAELARLRADPAIAAAHDRAVAAHRAKIAELKARPEQAAFYAELTGERLERLSRMLHIFGASVFSAGPEVIPPDLHQKPIPEGFFFTLDRAADAEA